MNKKRKSGGRKPYHDTTSRDQNQFHHLHNGIYQLEQEMREIRREKDKKDNELKQERERNAHLQRHINQLEQELDKNRREKEDTDDKLRQERERTTHLQRRMNHLEQVVDEIGRDKEQTDEELRLERHRNKSLQRTNQELYDSYIEIREKYNDVKLEVQKKTATLDDKDIEKWKKLSQEYFNLNRKILKGIDTKKDGNKERVSIKLPNKFKLQDFFEERCEESDPENSTFLF